MERNKKIYTEIKEKRSSTLKKSTFFCLFVQVLRRSMCAWFYLQGKTGERSKEILVFVGLYIVFFWSCYPPLDLMSLHLSPSGYTKSALSPVAEGFCSTGKRRRMILGCTSPDMSSLSRPHACMTVEASPLTLPSLMGSRKVVTFLDCLVLLKGGHCSL